MLFFHTQKKKGSTRLPLRDFAFMAQRTSEITRIMTPSTTALISTLRNVRSHTYSFLYPVPFLSFPSNYVLPRHLAVKASPHSWYLTPYMQNLFPFVPATTL